MADALKLTPHDQRRVAVVAGCDPRTVRARLEGRGSEDAETINRRFAKAQTEIEHYPFFDYIVVNKDINLAEAELRGIIYAERCRRWR